MVLCDGSILKGVTPPAAVEIVTKYGTLSVPFKDVRRIEFGLRLAALSWLRAWQDDTIITADCVLTGRLAAETLKIRSPVLGEVSVRIADLRLVRGAEEEIEQAAGGRVESDERKRARVVVELLRRFYRAYRAGEYKEALAFARFAHDLDPDNPVTTAAIVVSRNELKKQREAAAGNWKK